MVGGLDKVIYLPAMLTQRLGYFKDEGLDVELLSEPAGVAGRDRAGLRRGPGRRRLLRPHARPADQGQGRSSPSCSSRTRPARWRSSPTRRAGDITSPKDFKGKKLGVTGLGSSTDFLTKYLAVNNGVKASEFTPVAVGAGPTFIAALQQGSIDGGMTTDPTVATSWTRRLGKVLDRHAHAGGLRGRRSADRIPSSSLYMQTDWVNGHKDTVQKLANAFVKTLKWMSTHSAAEIAGEDAGRLLAGRQGALRGGHQEHAADVHQGRRDARGRPRDRREGAQGVQPEPQERQVDLDKTYTTEFVKKAG